MRPTLPADSAELSPFFPNESIQPAEILSIPSPLKPANLRESAAQLRAIFDNSLEAMVLLSDDRSVLDANIAALELFALSEEQMLMSRWDDLVPEERLVGIEDRWDTFLRTGVKRGEMCVRRSDMASRYIIFNACPHILPSRHLVCMRDVTDQKLAEDSLRFLSRRLMQLQDEERRRIARELHDSTGQCLAALRMNLDAIVRDSGGLPPKARRALDEALSLSRSCATDVRTISYLLHPPLLDDVGLVPALRWYIEGFTQRSGIQIHLDVAEPPVLLSKDLNTTLFRIIQESLTNILKHAGSKAAEIRLKFSADKISLEVRDFGQGIKLSCVNPPKRGIQGLGVGITGMRERVSQLGGQLLIESADPGTVVKAIFPWEDSHGSTTRTDC